MTSKTDYTNCQLESKINSRIAELDKINEINPKSSISDFQSVALNVLIIRELEALLK